jgi:cytochrome c oxidase subunit II
METSKMRIGSAALSGAALVAAFLFVNPVAPATVTPKRIEVVAKRFAFNPAEVTLKKGDPVVLVFRSADVVHGINFKELNIQTEIRKEAPSELSFTPQTAGDFVGHCSRFCGAGHGSMTLTLHVTE